MNIRPCRPGDETAICEIYNHYISNTTITFEETPLTVRQMQERIASCTELYPWLVCELEGEVAGYSYAGRFHHRAAYRFTAESTVYVRHNLARRGIGRALYEPLLSSLGAMGRHTVVALIALPNEASVGLHEALGFAKAGHLAEVGRKFERWIDVGFWQKKLEEVSPLPR